MMLVVRDPGKGVCSAVANDDCTRFSHTERQPGAVQKTREDYLGYLFSCGSRAHAIA